MKMNYRLIRSVKNKTVGARFLVPLAVLLAVALFHFFYPSLLQRAAHTIGDPLLRLRALSFSVAADTASYFRSLRSLIEERNGLSKKLREAEMLLADRNLLVEEIKLLKTTANRSVSEKQILAAVLAAPPRSPYDTLVLDAGKVDGVSEGDEVMNGATAVGTIQKVFLRTSIAELFSTAGRNTPVSILHEGLSIPGEALGQGGGMFKILLPKDVTIAVGDPVVIPKLTPAFFGAIEIVQGHITDSFQTLYFKSAAPVGRDLFVTIIPHVPDENI